MLRSLFFLSLFLFPIQLMAQEARVEPASAVPAECHDAQGHLLCARLNGRATIRIYQPGSCVVFTNSTDKDFFIPMRNGTNDYLAFLDHAKDLGIQQKLCSTCPPRCPIPESQPETPKAAD